MFQELKGNAEKVSEMVLSEWRSNLYCSSLPNILASYVIAYSPFDGSTEPHGHNFWRHVLTDHLLRLLESSIKDLIANQREDMPPE